MPYNLTPIHELCYNKDFDTLKKLLVFFTLNKIFIPPFQDFFGNTVFDVAKKNSFLLTQLVAYYSKKCELSEGLSKAFSDALPNLIQKQTAGLCNFMDQ